MKKTLTPLMLLLSSSLIAQDKSPELTEIWQPEPRVVTPGKTAADPPEDANLVGSRFHSSALLLTV